MVSLYALTFFWQASFVHGKPIFSATEVPTKAEKIGPRPELMQAY